jgi:hypothetical protein
MSASAALAVQQGGRRAFARRGSDRADRRRRCRHGLSFPSCQLGELRKAPRDQIADRGFDALRCVRRRRRAIRCGNRRRQCRVGGDDAALEAFFVGDCRERLQRLDDAGEARSTMRGSPIA